MTRAWWDGIRAEAMTCQSTQELIPQDVSPFLCESDVDDRNGHAAIFQVKFGKTTERAVKESRELSSSLLI